MLAAFLTTILFSLSAITGRRLSNYLSGTQANLIRLSFAAALLGTCVALCGFIVGGPAFLFLFLSGCIGFGVGDLSMFQAYPRIGTRRTIVMIQCLAAPFGAIAEWAWLGHAPTIAQAGFGAVILFGVGIALMPGKAEEQPPLGLTAGIFFGTLAALCQGLGAVFSRKAYAVAADAGQVFHGLSGGISATFQRLLGGVLITALFFVYLKVAHKPIVTRKPNWPAAWPLLIGNGLAGPTFGVICYQWALMIAPTNIVLPIVATTPLVVLPMAHFLEGDRITRRAIIGGILAVAGVVGLTLAR